MARRQSRLKPEVVVALVVPSPPDRSRQSGKTTLHRQLRRTRSISRQSIEAISKSCRKLLQRVRQPTIVTSAISVGAPLDRQIVPENQAPDHLDMSPTTGRRESEPHARGMPAAPHWALATPKCWSSKSHARGMPAAARPSARRSMKSGRNGQALLATATVRSGSLRRSLRAMRRASAPAPAWTAAAAMIRSPQNAAGRLRPRSLPTSPHDRSDRQRSGRSRCR